MTKEVLKSFWGNRANAVKWQYFCVILPLFLCILQSFVEKKLYKKEKTKRPKEIWETFWEVERNHMFNARTIEK